MQEIQIDSIVDLNNSFKQIDDLIAYIDKLDKRIQEINKGQISIGGIKTLRELREVTTQLQQASKELNAIIDQNNKTQATANEVKKESIKVNKESAQTQLLEAKAAKENETAKKTAAQTAKEQALVKKAESQALKELAAAEKLEAQAVKEGNAAKKIQAQTAKEIALTKLAEAKALKELYQAELIEAKTATEVAKAKKTETQEREKAEKAARAEQKMIDDIANDYKQLSLAYSDAALKAKNYAIRLGENHPITIQAIKDAKDLKTFLDRIDQATGDYRRNVGNYAGAFDSLGFSMQQILREAPSLAINLNTFFLAISNNLPQFFDAIEQAKKANASLAESGEKPVPVFKRLVGSLFSVQSALTIGITLITLFGTKLIDWFNSIGKGGGSVDKLKKQLAQFNEEVRQSNANLDSFFKYLDRLEKVPKIQLQIDNTNIPVLKAMQNELQAIGKEAETLQQKLDLAQEDFALKNRIFGAAEQNFNSKASDKAKEAFNNGSIEAIKDKISDSDKVLLEAVTTARDNFTQANEQIADLKTSVDVATKSVDLKSAEISKEAGEQARKITLDNKTAVLTIIKSQNDDILINERSTLQQRLNAIRSNYAAEQSLIRARKNDVLSDPTASAADRNGAIKQALSDSKAAQIAFERDVFNEKEEFRLRDLEANKSIFVRQKQLQSDAYKELSENLEFSLQDRLQLQMNFNEAQTDILKEEYRLKLQNAGLSDAEIEAFERDKTYKVRSKKITDAELLNLANEYESQILQLSIDTNKAITANIKSEIEKQQKLREDDVDNIQRIYSQIDLSTSNQYSEDVIALNNSLAKKEISIATYNKRRRKLDREFSQETISNTINEVLAQLQVYDGAEARLSAAEIKLTSLRNKFDDAKTDEGRKQIAKEIEVAEDEYNVAKKLVDEKIELEKKLTDNKKDESDKRKKTAEEEAEEERSALSAILGSAGSLGQSGQILSDGAFNKKMQQIQEEKDALEEKYQREVELINQTTAAGADRQQKLAEAEAKYAGQRKALEQQEKQERIRKAEFDKKAAIFNIIVSTAKAIVEALAQPFGFAKAVAIGAMGAAQLAVAISAPIPRFFKGKNLGKRNGNDSYEGPAIVDDGPDGRGGKPELIIREDGSMEVGSNQPRVTFLKKNDIVVPFGEKISKETLIKRSMINSGNAVVPMVNFIYNNDSEIKLMEKQNSIMHKGFNKLDSRLKHLNAGANKPKVNWHELWFIQDSLKKLNGN